MVSIAIGDVKSFDTAFSWGLVRNDAPEFPEVWKLSEVHEKELNESCISRKQALDLGLFSVTKEEAEVLTGHRHAGLCIPYFDLDGKVQRWGDDNRPFCRLKPYKPVFGAKYLSPKGAGNHIYHPSIKGNRRETLVISEGEKTIASFALNTDFDTVGLGGVWSFTDSTEDKSDRVLHPDLVTKIFSRNYDEIVIAFDSDVVGKKGVRRAITELTRSIMNAAADRASGDKTRSGEAEQIKLSFKLKFVLLPHTGGEKQGLDDLIYLYGPDAVVELFQNALPLVHYKKAKKAQQGEESSYSCIFSPEPFHTSKATDEATTENLARAMVLNLTMKRTCLMVPDLSPYLYSDDAHIWQPVGREAWQQAFYKACKWQGWKQRSRAAISDARGIIEGELSRPLEALDPLKYIGFSNGTLNLETGELEETKPDHLVTRRMRYEYAPGRKAPKFLKWLDWAFDDLEAIDAIQALLRWILEPKESKAYGIEVLFFLIGRPGVGKSTFLEVAKALAGNASTFNAAKLDEPEHLFSLRNKRLIYQSDLKGVINEQSIGALNKIADNTELGIRRLYNDGTEARLNTVVCLAANKPPQISVKDRAGFDRRAVYFNFEKQPDELVDGFTDALLEELPGIFNWAYEITVSQAKANIRNYQKGELQQSVSLKAINDSNTILQWLEDEHITESITIHPKTYVYQLYVEWCKESNAHPFAKGSFISRMVAMGCKEVRPPEQGRKRCLEWPPLEKMNLRAIADV